MKKNSGQTPSRKPKRAHPLKQPFLSPGFHPRTHNEERGSLVSSVRQFNLEFFGVRCTSALLTDEEPSQEAALAPPGESSNPASSAEDTISQTTSSKK